MVVYMGVPFLEIQSVQMGLAVLCFQDDVQVIPDDGAAQGNGRRMDIAFSYLADMRSADLVSVTGIVLYLVIRYPGVFVHYNLYDPTIISMTWLVKLSPAPSVV